MHTRSELSCRSLAVALVALASGCGARRATSTTPASPASPVAIGGQNPSTQGWLPANRARLDALLRSHGRGAPGHDPARPPVAVFDWDNTMMKNDIGDATLYWMLAHDRVLQPPARDWSALDPELTPAARASLGAACGALAAPGQPLPTSTDAACADALLAIYEHARTARHGEPAWEHETTATMHRTAAWAVRLQAGYTAAQIREFARSAYETNAAAPLGATQRVGSATDLAGYVRIYEPMRELVAALAQHGFEVWVVSASAQPVVETVAPRAGIAADHVIGVRALSNPDGRLGSHFAGCGTVPDGADTLITYDVGKRCWINRVVFRLPDALQLEPARDPSRRAVFAAGDADTDLAMVSDATEVHLAIDRARPALMAAARANRDGRWLVQPMFITP